jgi:hypothetical protein
LEEFLEDLPANEYYADPDAGFSAFARQSMFNLIDIGSGWKFDLIIRKTRAFSQEEFRRRQRITAEGISIWIASPEDIVVFKLEWAKLAGSRREIEDVSAILNLRWIPWITVT